jgi:hypothetical protein
MALRNIRLHRIRMQRNDVYGIKEMTKLCGVAVTAQVYLSGKCEGKGKGHPRTGNEGPEGEQMYSSTLPSTSALDGGRWSAPRPRPLYPPRKTRYPLDRSLDGPQERSPPDGDSILGPSSP